jgi:acyl-coenzyme A thioesterase PaaI-like protein
LLHARPDGTRDDNLAIVQQSGELGVFVAILPWIVMPHAVERSADILSVQIKQCESDRPPETRCQQIFLFLLRNRHAHVGSDRSHVLSIRSACEAFNNGGLNLHFNIDSAGVASAKWQPSPAFQSYPDRLHGGVIATLLDSAIVHALFANGIEGVTAEMTIRYFKGVGLHDFVIVTGSVVSKRHGVYLCRAEVHQCGNCAVRASAKFMAMAPPVTQENS